MSLKPLLDHYVEQLTPADLARFPRVDDEQDRRGLSRFWPEMALGAVTAVVLLLGLGVSPFTATDKAVEVRDCPSCASVGEWDPPSGEVPPSVAVTSPAQLVGAWQVEALDGRSVSDGDAVTLAFAGDGTWRLDAGCGAADGVYRLSAGGLLHVLNVRDETRSCSNVAARLGFGPDAWSATLQSRRLVLSSLVMGGEVALVRLAPARE